MTSNVQQKIEDLVLPILTRMGYKLWGCQCMLHQKQRLIRILIDKPDGILVSDCEQVSHAISAVFDVENIIADHYRLEISSPGYPRPLFYAWQYQENIGELARIKLIRTLEGQRWLVGIITTVDDNGVNLRLEDKEYRITWDNISKAQLENTSLNFK
jgi:ribosome maturation factor RimP